MKQIYKSPVIIFSAGFLIALSAMGLGLVYLNPEQCPLDYTQAQVDASDCIVGANIGLGLILIVAVAILAGTSLIAISVRQSKKK